MYFFDYGVVRSGETEEGFQGQTIIEILEDNRVLIEGHGGVKVYSQEKIVVNSKKGMVCICGCAMEIIRMTRERLVIRGRFDAINLLRR